MMEPFQQDLIIGQIARWMMDLFSHSFDKIGGLYPVEGVPGAVCTGAVPQALFYNDGRSEYPLDRGPFSSAKDYLSGCAQRELDSSRFMFSQDTSKAYQMKLQEEKDNVERSMHLFEQLIQHCPGLDGGDPEMAPFTLDMHELPMRSIIVDWEDYTRIVGHLDKTVVYSSLTALDRFLLSSLHWPHYHDGVAPECLLGFHPLYLNRVKKRTEPGGRGNSGKRSSASRATIHSFCVLWRAKIHDTPYLMSASLMLSRTAFFLCRRYKACRSL
jgi:hypothetical protein